MDNSLLVKLCEQSHSLDKLRRYLLKSRAVLVVRRKMDAIQTSSAGQEKPRELDTPRDQESSNQARRPNSAFVTDESPHSRIWNLGYTLSAKKYCQEKGLALTSLNRVSDIYYQRLINGKICPQHITTVLAGVFLNSKSNSAQVILLCSQINKLRDRTLREQLILYMLSQYPDKPVLLMTWQDKVQLELYSCTKGGIFPWRKQR